MWFSVNNYINLLALLTNCRLKEEIMKSGMRPPNTVDPHWLEIQRRYAAAGLAGPPGGPGLLPHHFALYPGGSAAQLSQLERERYA